MVSVEGRIFSKICYQKPLLEIATRNHYWKSLQKIAIGNQYWKLLLETIPKIITKNLLLVFKVYILRPES
jgi:hypothetical protein